MPVAAVGLNLLIHYSLSLVRSLNTTILGPIQVWSVPSITITRRLGLVQVEEDNQTIMFREGANMTEIYVREQLSAAELPNRTFKLAQFFSGRFDIGPANMNLLSLLISSPLETLSSVLAEHDIFLSNERSGSEQNNEVASVVQDLAAMHLGGRETGEYHRTTDEERDGYTGESRHPHTTSRENRLSVIQTTGSTARERLPPPSLVELIPSLQSRTQTIIHHAREISNSSILVARLPMQSPGTSGEPLKPQLMRTSRDANVQATVATARFISPTRGSTSQPSVWADGGHITPPVSSHSTLARTSPTHEVRNRQIGQLGERHVRDSSI